MNVALYARKSNEQEKGLSGKSESVERQLEHGRAFTESRGWIVSHTFTDDNVSGATFAKLKGRRAMMEAAEAGAFQILIVSEQNRLGRHMIESANAIMEIADSGVRIFAYLGGQEIKVETALDQAQVMLTGFAGSAERKAASDRSRDKAVQLARAGFVHGGRVYGYANQQGQGGKVRTVNPEQAEIVRRIFQLYADGAGHRGIRDQLNLEHVKGPRGKWATTTVRDILSNPIYTGIVRWGRMRVAVKKGRRVNVPVPEDQWIAKEMPGMRIVSDEVWKAAQARREQRRQVTPRGKGGRLMGRTSQDDIRSQHLLSGFLSCKVCGGPLRIKTERRRGINVSHYVCSTRHTRGVSACANWVGVGELAMNTAVLQAVGRALAPEQIERALEMLLAVRREREHARSRHRESLARDLAEADRRVSNLVAAVTRGDAVEPLIEALRTERDKQKAIRSELEELEAKPSGPPPLGHGPGVPPLLRGKVPGWELHEEYYRAACRKRVDDVLTLLDSKAGIGPCRGMLRLALAGPIVCTPEARGFRFSAPLDLGRLIEGTTSRMGDSPPGTSTCRWRDRSRAA